MMYSIMLTHLLLKYIFSKEKYKTPPPLISPQAFVSVQLPIYNELYVVERLIDCVCKFDYPKELYEIRILDDSTDKTSEIIAKKVKYYISQGFQIHHVQRANRRGFKAGALKEDLPHCKGEFIAIFDADFLPKRDFLLDCLPFFEDKKVGIVQTKWGNVNEKYSILTRLQAFQLNLHFSIEQKGREKAGYFLQFNGTGGIWRKKAILDAGGWQADTLTEDLDLSIRAQLKDYKIVYRPTIESPAELPIEMNGFKAQQYRWMKGGAETTKKLIGTIWNSSLKPIKKIHSIGQLLSSTIFILVLSLAILSFPILIFDHKDLIPSKYFGIFFFSMFPVFFVYLTANVFAFPYFGKWRNRLLHFFGNFFLFLSFSMGLSLHNSIAVIQGFLGKRTPFVRTPKYNILDKSDSHKTKVYKSKNFPLIITFESLLCIYFIIAIFYALTIGVYSFLIYHSLLVLGFGSISYLSLRDQRWNKP